MRSLVNIYYCFIGGLLGDHMHDLCDCIDNRMANKFIETLLPDIVSTQVCIDLLATILDVLIDPARARQAEDDDYMDREWPVVCSNTANETGLCVSRKALENIVEFAVRSTGVELYSAIYTVLKERLDSTTVTGTQVAAMTQGSCDAVSTVREEKDVFMSSLHSLFSTQFTDCHQNSSSKLTPPPNNYSAVVKPDHLDAHWLVSRQTVIMSCSFISDKLNEIFTRLHDSCTHNSRAKALLESSQMSSQSADLVFCKPSIVTPALSDKSMTKLLKHCVQFPSPFSAKIAAVLFEMSTVSFFKTTLLSELCEHLDSVPKMKDERHRSFLESQQLYRLKVLSSYLDHLIRRGKDKPEAIEEKEAVKIFGKRVWPVCSEVITDTASYCQDNIVSQPLVYNRPHILRWILRYQLTVFLDVSI